GVLWRALLEAYAKERLGPNRAAQLDEFLQARSGRLQTTPGAEGLAPVGISDRVAPLEFAQVGIVQRATAEADHAGLEGPERRAPVRTPAADRFFGHQRGVVEPQRAGTAKCDRQRGVGPRGRRHQPDLILLPGAPGRKLAGGQ